MALVLQWSSEFDIKIDIFAVDRMSTQLDELDRKGTSFETGVSHIGNVPFPHSTELRDPQGLQSG